MNLVWYCSKCNKKVIKKPKKIGNTIYYPDRVTHKHGKYDYVLTCYTLDEYMRNGPGY